MFVACAICLVVGLVFGAILGFAKGMVVCDEIENSTKATINHLQNQVDDNNLKMQKQEELLADVWQSYDAYKEAMREVFWNQERQLTNACCDSCLNKRSRTQ